ncbi:unnamed protein product [Mytilus coruscus]|uniref:Uncharacterized protein n=1 Tax=Mytilus coruscus TaxID=42192 RepID=A0A6J8BHD5_MYTCO|nr:unnamed protein product [Mytilus coruscus]
MYTHLVEVENMNIELVNNSPYYCIIGVAGCQISEYVIDTSKHKLITQKLKGINDVNELQFEEDGILLRKAYNIGKRKFIPNESLDQMGFGKQQENKSGCLVISGFDLPVNFTGIIKTPKTVPAVNLHGGQETEIDNSEDAFRLTFLSFRTF